MHFYGMSDRQVLDMPAKRFWMLNKNVDRLRAEADVRLVQCLISSQTGKGVEQMTEILRQQMGKVVTIDEGKAAVANAVYDRDKAMAFKERLKQQNLKRARS